MVLTSPTNVQYNNPYVGLDRGLFVLTGRFATDTQKFARISSATVTGWGAAQSIGMLEYQVMTYAELPTTAEDYDGGTVLTDPLNDNSPTFKGLFKGIMITGIMVEYWAKLGFMENISLPTPIFLADVAINQAKSQADAFTKISGKPFGITELSYSIEYDSINHPPLVPTSSTCTYLKGDPSVSKTITLSLTQDPIYDVFKDATT